MDKYGETDPNVSELRGPPILRAKHYIKINKLMENAKEKCVPYNQPQLQTECNSVEDGEQEEEEEFVPKAQNLRPRKPLKAAKKPYALRRANNVSKLRGPPILRAKHYFKLMENAKEKCVPYDQPLLETECNSVEGGEQEEFVPKTWNLKPRKPLKAAKKPSALRRAKNVKKEALGLSLVEPSPDQSPLPFKIDCDTEEEEPIRTKIHLLKDIYDSTKCGSYNYPKRDD